MSIFYFKFKSYYYSEILLSSFLVILFYKNNFKPHKKTNMGGKKKGKGKKGGDPAKG